MNFKRCDRCSEEIKEKVGIAEALTVMTDMVMRAVNAMTGKPTYEIYKGETKADLCPACRKSFSEWMDAGAKSQHPDQQEKQESNRNTKIVVAAIEDPIMEPEKIKFGNF